MPPVAAHRARKAVPRGPSVPAPVEAGAVARERAGRVTPGAVAHELRAGWATMLPVATPVQAARCCPPASHPGPLPRSAATRQRAEIGRGAGPEKCRAGGRPSSRHQFGGTGACEHPRVAPAGPRCSRRSAGASSPRHGAPCRPPGNLHGPLHRSAAAGRRTPACTTL